MFHYSLGGHLGFQKTVAFNMFWSVSFLLSYLQLEVVAKLRIAIKSFRKMYYPCRNLKVVKGKQREIVKKGLPHLHCKLVKEECCEIE